MHYEYREIDGTWKKLQRTENVNCGNGKAGFCCMSLALYVI
jgi:hypothetical protein